jgi:hypothetical protein
MTQLKLASLTSGSGTPSPESAWWCPSTRHADSVPTIPATLAAHAWPATAPGYGRAHPLSAVVALSAATHGER